MARIFFVCFYYFYLLVLLLYFGLSYIGFRFSFFFRSVTEITLCRLINVNLIITKRTRIVVFKCENVLKCFIVDKTSTDIIIDIYKVSIFKFMVTTRVHCFFRIFYFRFQMIYVPCVCISD